MAVVEIETDLTKAQLSKFKTLFTSMKIIGGKAYFLTKDMHGVLLTNSKQKAFNIVQANLKHVQIYLINLDDEQYIKHIGIDVLLDRLSETNPKKTTQYLAARAYVSAFLANNSEVFKDATLRGKELDQQKIQVMQDVKKYATHCALTKKIFKKGDECHIHHIEGVSEKPELANDSSNLLPLCKKVHEDYHAWVIREGQAITRASLKHFALLNNYNRDWSTFTGDAIFAANHDSYKSA